MYVIKSILKVIALLAGVLLVVLAIFIYATGPSLPEGSEAIIGRVLKNPVPEIIKGRSGITGRQPRMWYECIDPADSAKGSILLIMGISNDGLSWPQKFIEKLVKAGYRVIRFDHRGTGMSDWMKDWKKDRPYSLKDMAADGISILDELGIKKAHLVGVSMGGMIAQETAIHFPERVATLCSIMSSGFIADPTLTPISRTTTLKLVGVAIRYSINTSEKNMVKLFLATHQVLKGEATYDVNVQEIAETVLYNLRNRKGFNNRVLMQHQAAVERSGSRYEGLMKLQLPVLIVHGRQDPLISLEHSRRCAKLIPGADTLWMENMGHDIAEIHVEPLCERIIHNCMKISD